MIGGLANIVALHELRKAIDVLRVSHKELPELRDNNGNVISDARDKRLVLVEKHLGVAGNVLSMEGKATNGVAAAVQSMLMLEFPDATREALLQVGAPPEVVDAMFGQEKRLDFFQRRNFNPSDN